MSRRPVPPPPPGVIRRLRPRIIREIEKLERKYGAMAVTSAFNRHVQVRRERRKLDRQLRETREKIAQLKR